MDSSTFLNALAINFESVDDVVLKGGPRCGAHIGVGKVTSQMLGATPYVG